MFEGFFTSMQVAWAGCQISARHQLKPPKTLACHHPLEHALYDTLNSSSSGVFVHWGVYESGKTTAVREASWRLQEEGGREVILLHGYNFRWLRPMKTWLRHAIGIPNEMHDRAISDLLIMPTTTLVIDHFDMLMREKDNTDDEALELVRHLISESALTQKFNVLLVVTSWERAKELVDAGCKLMPGGPARWTHDQLEILFSTMTVSGKALEKKDELLRLATLSGTPGFLRFELHSGERTDSRHAAMHDLEWRKGTQALYGGSVLGPGRFPDRNGVYHHEDLASIKPP